MLDLGTVRPGSTIRIPFSSFDKDDGSSITMTNYAAADILVYKDGGTTERASTAGFTATTDFDTKTGKHLAVIDLADDTTADFWKAGSEYLVAIDAVTVDAVTTGGWIARFTIGYPGAFLNTHIATLASQTSFTLNAGPAEDDALNGMVLLIHDKASAVQVTRVVVEDYTGSTKTVTLRAAPATTFTVAAGDNVSAVGFDLVNVTHFGGTAGTFSGGRPEVNTTHAAGTAWGSGAITAASIADGAIDLATFAADAKALFGVIAFGTAQSVTGTTIRLASAETFADDELIGATVLIRSATTGAGQSRVITDYVSATDTATVDTWTTTPTGTVTYVVFGTAPASTSAPIAANVTQWAGSAVATPTVAGVPEVDVTHNGGTAITVASGIQEVKVASIAANAITATSIASDAITDAKVAADVTIASVTGAVGSVTGNVGGNVVGSVGSVTGAVGSVTGLTASDVAAIKAKTDNLPATPAATGDAMTLTSAYDFAKGTVAMTESYATDGATMTPAQAFYQIWSLLAEKNIASTTLTAKKLDGSTTAMTFTLDDATNPTSITRAT